MNTQNEIELVTAIVTKYPSIPPSACLVAPLIIEQFNSDLDLNYKLTTQNMVDWFGFIEELKASHLIAGTIINLEEAVVSASEEVFLPLYPANDEPAVRKNIEWIREQILMADRIVRGTGN